MCVGKIDPVFPNKVISRCPAIMFADSRIAKVPGRIIFLIVSIHTINGIRTGGFLEELNVQICE